MNPKRPGLSRLPAAPPMFPGFEGINRFYESASKHWIAQILPGDFYVSKHDEIITTVLGSCVSTCIRDPGAGVGGMNHFMLPDDPAGKAGASARYGLFAMEQLINALMRRGARRETMETKVVGGGRVISGMGDVGRSNVAFVRQFLADEQMAIVVEDVGLQVARRVRYHPVTGQVRVLHLPMEENRKVADRETELASKIRGITKRAPEVELF
jgi:chemotaxis protein CheD